MDEEREHNARMLETHRGNLRKLLEQKAKFGGIEVPLWLENQIAEQRTQIAFYEPLAPPQKQADTAERVSGSIDLTTLYMQGAQIAAEQARQADQNKEIIEQQARDALWRIGAKEVIDEVVQRFVAMDTRVSENEAEQNWRYEQEQIVRKQRQTENDERQTGVEQSIDSLSSRLSGMWWLIFDTAAVVGLVVALVMWWLS